MIVIGMPLHLDDYVESECLDLAADRVSPIGRNVAIDATLREGRERDAHNLITRGQVRNVRDALGLRLFLEPRFGSIALTHRDDLQRSSHDNAVVEAAA